MTHPIADQLIKVSYDITNKSTSVVGKIFVALAIITALGALATFCGAHSIAGPGSGVLVFGGGAAVLSGIIYAGMKIRDWKERVAIDKEWKSMGDGDKNYRKNELITKIMAISKGDEIITPIKLNGEEYSLRARRGDKGVKIYKYES